MMDCTEYRRALLTDPGHPSAEMLTHVADCQACTGYTERVLRFESRLERALQVNPHAAEGARPSSSAAVGRRLDGRARLRRRGFAIAASVLLATFAAGSLWLAAPGRSLAAAVVDHMSGEPEAWVRTGVPVAESRLDAVMSQSGVHLKPSAGLVSYANSCEFRGHQVPHLVVQTAAGPVTVMVLTHESVSRQVHFDEHGYRGMIVPVHGHGSLAVLEHTPNIAPQPIDAVATQVLGALDWTAQ